LDSIQQNQDLYDELIACIFEQSECPVADVDVDQSGFTVSDVTWDKTRSEGTATVRGTWSAVAGGSWLDDAGDIPLHGTLSASIRLEHPGGQNLLGGRGSRLRGRERLRLRHIAVGGAWHSRSFAPPWPS
jgi:hypothetical protein